MKNFGEFFYKIETGKKMSTKSVADQIVTDGRFTAMFPGWGEPRIVALNYKSAAEEVDIFADTKTDTDGKSTLKDHLNQHPAKLNALLGISIAGCDLMGSALYTAGTCAYNSGKVIHDLMILPIPPSHHLFSL